jgi:hypothetical protein
MQPTHTTSAPSFSARLGGEAIIDRTMNMNVLFRFLVLLVWLAGGVLVHAEGPVRGVDLAPADTLALIEIHDIPRTLKRWEQTSLAQIAQEPEWKDFTSKVGDFVGKQGAPVLAILDQVKTADPTGAFVALTAINRTGPGFIGGIAYRGEQAKVKELVGKLQEMMKANMPGTKVDTSQHAGTDIWAATSSDFTLAIAHTQGWVLFGSSINTVKELLDRKAGAANASPALAKDATFAECLKQGAADPDVTAYLSWKNIQAGIDKLNQGRPGMAVSVLSFGFLGKNAPEAMLYTTKLDGLLMRDRLYARMPKVPKSTPLASRLLAFTTPQTYAFANANLAAWEATYKEAMEELQKSPSMKGDVKKLADQGLKLEELFAIFGPEISIHSDWEEGPLTIPTMFAALEVRDAAKAKAFAEFIAAQMKTEGDLSKKEEDGTTYWTLAFGAQVIQPTLAINDKHLVFSLTYAGAFNGIKQFKSGGDTLAKTPGFAPALKTVTPPTMGVVYVDLKTLFERAYDKFKPSLAFAISGQKELADVLDAGKIPKAATISKHLLPFVVTYSDAPGGFLLDGSGSISLYGGALPLMAAFFGFRTSAVAPAIR